MPVLNRRLRKDAVSWLEGASHYALTCDSIRSVELAEAASENPWSALDDAAAGRLMIAYEDRLLRIWIADYDGAGRRPWSWWRFVAKEPRRVVAGEWTPIAGRFKWTDEGAPYGAHAATVETQAEYLDRLNLWQRGEKARVARREPHP